MHTGELLLLIYPIKLIKKGLDFVYQIWYTNLSDDRRVRILFYIADGHMVLLHALIKKTRKLPDNDLDLARQRMKELMS